MSTFSVIFDHFVAPRANPMFGRSDFVIQIDYPAKALTVVILPEFQGSFAPSSTKATHCHPNMSRAIETRRSTNAKLFARRCPKQIEPVFESGDASVSHHCRSLLPPIRLESIFPMWPEYSGSPYPSVRGGASSQKVPALGLTIIIECPTFR